MRFTLFAIVILALMTSTLAFRARMMNRFKQENPPGCPTYQEMYDFCDRDGFIQGGQCSDQVQPNTLCGGLYLSGCCPGFCDNPTQYAPQQ